MYQYSQQLWLQILGGDDCHQPVDSELWVCGMQDESISIPPLFPRRFKNRADKLLQAGSS